MQLCGQLAGHVVQTRGHEVLHGRAQVLDVLTQRLGGIGGLAHLGGRLPQTGAGLDDPGERAQLGGQLVRPSSGAVDLELLQCCVVGLLTCREDGVACALEELGLLGDLPGDSRRLGCQSGQCLGIVLGPADQHVVLVGRGHPRLGLDLAQRLGERADDACSLGDGSSPRGRGPGVRVHQGEDLCSGMGALQGRPARRVLGRLLLEQDQRAPGRGPPSAQLDGPTGLRQCGGCPGVGLLGLVDPGHHLGRMGVEHRRDRVQGEREGCGGELRPREVRLGQVDVDRGEQLDEVGHVTAQTGPRLLERGLDLLPALDQVALDAGVLRDVEESLEDLTPLLVAGPQEGGEVALGEHHDPPELVQPHPELVVEQPRALVDAGAQGGPRVPGELLEQDAGGLGGGAGAALLGTLVRGVTTDAQSTAGQGQLELDAGRRGLLGVLAAQARREAVPGDVGVQREADRVEEARLAGARGAVDEEETRGADLLEVEVDGPGEGTEGRGRQTVQPHAAPRRLLRPASSARS